MNVIDRHDEPVTLVRCGCGGEVIILKADEYHQFPDTYYVSCTKCTAGVGPYDTESEAIRAWNRAMRRAKVDILPNTLEDKGEMPFCPHCGDELEWSEL